MGLERGSGFMRLRRALPVMCVVALFAGSAQAQFGPVAAQSKMLKYATDNATWCGIPNQVVSDLKGGITKTSEIRTRVCQAAAAPQRPAGPSLSDALSGPVPDSNNIKTGRGTFDTLTGNPLEKK